MKNYLLCLPFIFFFTIACASCHSKHAEKSMHSEPSKENYWTSVAPAEIKKVNTPLPSNYTAYKLDEDAIRKKLAPASAFSPVIIMVPMPDGSYLKLSMTESQVMAPELAAKFPLIKTYQGKSIEKTGITARIEINETDFHVMLLTEDGQIFIDPMGDSSQNFYISYFKNDAPKRETPFEETPKH